MMFIVGFIVGMFLAYLTIALIVLLTDDVNYPQQFTDASKPDQSHGGTDEGV